MTDKTSLSYKDAGVDIDAGNALVGRIKGVVKKTRRPEVMGGLGGFGALCALPQKYREPVLVSGTDGVGTKLRLAMDLKRHDTIGIDLVAMCVNDLVVQGAEPLFFLDYYATGKLDVDTASAVISGIAEGCLQSGCSLVGGETAEMPGMYHGEDYDVAGFCVGVVEKSEIIDGSKVSDGDVLIALGSSGPHSNGYSLVRKILEVSGCDPQTTELDGKPLADHLLAPTRIYVKSVLELIEKVDVHAIAHLTGGGFWENIPRGVEFYSKTLYFRSREALHHLNIQHLRRSHSLRHGRRHTRKGERGTINIVNGTPIHERSRNIDNRRSLGHWEGDLVSGTKNSHIATLVDRKSRYTIILRLRGKDSVSVNQALTDKFLSLPSELRKSLTWDRGMELARHLEFTVSTGVKVYFCDPQSPWQRGTNENTNGLIRQYFPKKICLAQYTQHELDLVAAQLNNRPRKTLKFKTPKEIIERGVALTD